MSLKANCCPRCLTLKTDEPGHVHTCSPTPMMRAMERLCEACDDLVDNHGVGRERGLSEIPTEVLQRILGALEATSGPF